MKVLVMDMGSKLNRYGGQQRMAAVLQKGLRKYFQTSYLGYRTEFIKGSKADIVLPSSKILPQSLRKNVLSEVGFIRAGYYFLVVRHLTGFGMSREKLGSKVAALNPDVIVSNSVQDFSWLRYFKRTGINFRSVYVDHGTIANDDISGYFSKEGVPLTIGTGIRAVKMKNAKRKFFNFFDMNIALNKMHERNMKRYTKKVEYIPNGVPKLQTSNKKINNMLRNRYDINENDFVVLYVGRMFERQKNVSTLIRAFAGIKGKRFKLLLVGGGPSKSDYIELASNDERIKFVDHIEDRLMPHLFDIASVFVLPSVWEGFSLTLLEAASHSLPIILSHNAYIEDLKQRKIGSILSFSTFNAEELASLIHVLEGSERVRKKAMQVSKNIYSTFTQDRMLSSYKKLIESL